LHEFSLFFLAGIQFAHSTFSFFSSCFLCFILLCINNPLFYFFLAVMTNDTYANHNNAPFFSFKIIKSSSVGDRVRESDHKIDKFTDVHLFYFYKNKVKIVLLFLKFSMNRVYVFVFSFNRIQFTHPIALKILLEITWGCGLAAMTETFSFLYIRVRSSLCMSVTLAVPYLSTGLAGCSMDLRISRGACKLARTPWIIKKKSRWKEI